MNNNLKHRGFSLLELLVYIFFSITLSSIVSQAFLSMNKPYLITKETLLDREKLYNLEESLFLPITKYTLSKHIPTHRWHHLSDAPDYLIQKVNNLSTNSRPNTNAAILELLELEGSMLLRNDIQHARFQGSFNKSTYINGDIKAWFSPEPMNDYLIFEKPKVVFLAKDLIQIEFNETNLNAAKEIFSIKHTINHSGQTSTPAIIYPIKDHFLLFTTSNNTLRRISLLSNENQPLLEEVSLEHTQEGFCEIKLTNSNLKKSIECTTHLEAPLMRLHALDF